MGVMISEKAYRYINPDLAELGHQLTLSPRRLRPTQIQGLERMMDLVDPDESYPYDWIVFHITGRRPHQPDGRESILGSVLLADLPTMAEHLTRRGAPRIEDLSGAYRTHDDVAAEFNISTKTLRRWRSKGLLGIRAVTEGNKPRLVFSERSISRFKKRNADLIERGRAFKLLSPAEKDQIVELSRELLAARRKPLHIIAREVATRIGRASETVRYTLRQHDTAHPDDALFARYGDPVAARRHLAIWRSHKRGESIAAIARAQGLDPDAVRAVLRELRARRLKETRIDYVDHELFHAPDADARILEIDRPEPAPVVKPSRVPTDLPAYLRALYDTPLLTRDQEADLFLRYNYLRFKAASITRDLDPCTATDDDLDRIEHALAQAQSVKKEIIQANLRLVVSIAKRHMRRNHNFFELISDGNMSMIRAVEKFDVSLGNKFSTYASWAIMKNFARSIPEKHYHSRKYITGQDELIDVAAARSDEFASPTDLETVRGALKQGLSQLTERESVIVQRHFGLGAKPGQESTLEELGRKFGVTKERIRQIEKRAIEKLRDILSPALLDSFAG